MSEPAVDFGAIIAADMIEEAAERGLVSGVPAVPAPVAAPQPVRVVRQETAVQAPVEEEAEVVAEADVVEPFTIDVELPDDIEELLAADDEEPDDIYTPPVDDHDEWVDPEIARLRAENEKLRRKAEHADKLRLQASLPKWQAEAAKFFPLSDPTSIEADSRKDFMRKAAAQHDALKPAFQKFQAQQQSVLEAERAKIRAEVEAETQKAWGRPLTGPGSVPVESADKAARLAAARKTGNLEKIIAIQLENT